MERCKIVCTYKVVSGHMKALPEELMKLATRKNRASRGYRCKKEVGEITAGHPFGIVLLVV